MPFYLFYFLEFISNLEILQEVLRGTRREDSDDSGSDSDDSGSDSENDSDSDLESKAKKEFSRLDKDGDGFITVEEMKQYLLEDSINHDEEETKVMEQMILAMDDDDDGKISFTGNFF